MKADYIEFDPKEGYPRGADLYYECGQCHRRLPSMSETTVCCDCYNLCVDVEAGRLGVQDDSLVKLVCLKPNAD